MNIINKLSLVAIFATSTLQAQDPSKLLESMPPMPELEVQINDLSEKTGTLIAKGWMAIDEDGDGRVPMKDVLKSLMGKGFARVGEGPVPAEAEQQGGAEAYLKGMAEMDKTVAKRLKGDEDGMLGQKEGVELFKTALYELVIGPKAILDTNHDAKLSLEEVATSIPIRKGETPDEEGFTERQRKGFARQDTNKDGYISSLEWLDPMTLHFMEEIAEILAITMWIDTLDTDSDGAVSKQELATVLPEAGDNLPESIPLNQAITYIRSLPHDLHHELSAALLPTD
ncbi:hypothetical protein MLD52_07290 [Puniceicoccaceae bacterium K14]|nr:hypothetical protein [Puniceicoccaceae bacterium K14]